MNSTERHSVWRIIYSGARRGSWNMAVDEAILESAGEGAAPPTLRLYAWQPACLSLGIAQSFADVDRAALVRHGWQVVRRPTGGRAILHTDELTYSICGRQSEPCLAGGVLESYRLISGALLRALRLLGVEASASKNSGGRAGFRDGGRDQVGKSFDPVCFTEPSNYEITAGGKKLIGSAQARRGEAVLQHGTLPLTGDIRRIVQVLRFGTQAERRAAASRVTSRAVTIEQVLGKPVSWEEAAAAMQQAFEEVLGFVFEPGELTSREVARAAEIEALKHANPEWTERL